MKLLQVELFPLSLLREHQMSTCVIVKVKEEKNLLLSLILSTRILVINTFSKRTKFIRSFKCPFSH